MTTLRQRKRNSEIGIARFLIPAEANTQEYWNENWPVIETLLTLEAVLQERIHFFKSKKYQREDAISLIAIADMAWQQMRILAGIKGKDSVWLKEHLPEDYDDLKEMGFDLFDHDIAIVDGLQWIFDLHSALRHPTKVKMERHPFLLHDPWPGKEANNLYNACSNLLNVLSIFTSEFDESGWEDDVLKKRELAQAARGTNA